MSILGGAAITGGLSYLGGRDTNRANAKEAQKDRNFQSQQSLQHMRFQDEQATRQLGFQKMMSDTSHQREISDLKKAGLNPILSLGKGAQSGAGASGSGASGSGSRAQMKDPITPAISSAMAGARFEKEMDLLDAQIRKTINDGTISKNTGDITEVPATVANVIKQKVGGSAKAIKNIDTNMNAIFRPKLIELTESSKERLSRERKKKLYRQRQLEWQKNRK